MELRIDKSKVLDCFILLCWILLLFSGTRMVTRYYVNNLTIILCIYYFVYMLSNHFVVSKITFFVSAMFLWPIMSVVWSVSQESTMTYMSFLVLGFIFLCSNKSLNIKKGIYLFGESFCVLLAISILLETVNIRLVYDNFWFLFEKSKGAAGYLLDIKKGDMYIGAFSGIVGEKADAAFILVIGLILIWGNIFLNHNKNKIVSVKLYFECIIVYIALFLTGKRTLFICSFFIIILMLLIYAKENPSKVINKIILVLFFVIIMLYASQFIEGTEMIFERLAIKGSEDDAMLARKQIWNVCFDMFSKFPLAGGGFASFITYCNKNWFETTSFAHNIYIEWMAELGIIGVIIALVSLIILFYKIHKIYDNLLALSDELRFDYAFNISVLIVILIYGMTGNCMYYPAQFMWLLWSIKSIIQLSNELA